VYVEDNKAAQDEEKMHARMAKCKNIVGGVSVPIFLLCENVRG
jgi:hypothetical protein